MYFTAPAAGASCTFDLNCVSIDGEGQAQFRGDDVSVGEDTNILSYTDAFEISEYAIPAIQWACGTGLLQGRTASTIDLGSYTTRAETAAILAKFAKHGNGSAV